MPDEGSGRGAANSLVVVDPDSAFASEVCAYFRSQGWGAHACASAEAALAALGAIRPDMVLAERALPGKRAIELAVLVHQHCPRTRVIVMSAEHPDRAVLAAMKTGDIGFVAKPVAASDLFERAAAELARHRAAEESGDDRDAAVEALVGHSPTLLALKAMLRSLNAAARRVDGAAFPAILIEGETGTGKELVARALHFGGRGHGRPLVEVNCACLPPPLLEAELFGFERGAFTDARAAKPGLFEEANGGTLFLDEIGELDRSVQPKLLKFLEERQVRRLGSTRERALNVRIVCATNRDLQAQVRAERFRSDLYFRLRGVVIKMPALRERGDDILLLARRFLVLHGIRYDKPDLRFTPGAEQLLLDYDWPGNVRELRNVVEGAVALASAPEISAAALALPAKPALADPRSGPEASAGGEGIGRLQPFYGRLAGVAAEKICRILEATDWNVSKSARLLGITREVLRYWMVKHHRGRSAT
jgi:two-component system response regulator AtoC